MAGYGPTEMVQTPWGRADQLRERMLRPGPGMPREDVARSQRERLFGATVACVASQGYEATTVADLLDLSGVSRSAFYEHFRDKEDCVLATFDALVARTVKLVRAEVEQNGSWDARATYALDMLFDAIVKQKAAASLCFCDIYAVGERGRLAVEQAMARVTDVGEEAIAEIRGSRLPRNLVHGLVGGVHIVIQTHLRREEAERLPEYAKSLRDLVLSYEAPSAPLRLGGRRPRPIGGPPPFVAYSQAEKIVRALAAAAGERGYPAVTVAEIAARAAISQATFYSHFADKHAALVAAIDSAGSQMLGVAMPAARRASDWPSAIRAAIGGLCAFYASEPDLARLAVVEIYSAGSVALTQRDRRFEAFLALLEPALGASPAVQSVVADVVLGAVWTLVYEQITTGEPEELPQIAPVATYVILSPFLGSKEALRVSNGDGRGQPSR
jgi:AcrR family transcriptional regulator